MHAPRLLAITALLAAGCTHTSKQADADAAYKRGMAQSAKLAYDAIQNSQRNGIPEEQSAATPQHDEVLRLPITAPARVINGVRINPSQEILTIQKN